ncbi:MAG TPA: amino acid permease [Myxococcota bacterium]|nr:amino acid permease [Myxococcota bacterium]HQK50142.1 amino acid permease [Myxococcota bacterium]
MEEATTHSRGDLVRHIGAWTATALVVGSVVGSGIFKKAAPMAQSLPSPTLVLLVWLLAAGLSFLGALSAAELASTFPDAGGLYGHLGRAFGPFTGFLYGWSVLSVIQTGTLASIAYIFAEYLRPFVGWGDSPPGLAAWGVTLWGVIDLYPLRELGTKAVAVGALLVVTLMNVQGVRLGARVQDAFLWVKLAILAGIVGVGVAGARSGAFDGSLLPATLDPGIVGPMPLLAALTLALSGAFWAYDGWINVTYVGSEMRRPSRDFPLALVLGMGIVTLGYLGVNWAYFALLPLERVQSSTLVAADAVAQVLPFGAALVSLAVVLSTFGALHGTSLVSARVYWAMSRDGLLWRGLDAVHPRRGTPHVALWVQWAWSSVLVFSGTFDQITDMMVVVSWAFYGLLAAAVIVLRVRRPDVPRPYRVPGYPWVPAIFVVFSAIYVALSFRENTRNALLGGLLVAVGVPFYRWFRRGRGLLGP